MKNQAEGPKPDLIWVTVDTGGLNLYGKPPHGPWLGKLEQWAKEGRIFLASAPTIWAEILRHHSPKYRQRAADKIKAIFSQLGTPITFRFEQKGNPKNVREFHNMVPTQLFRSVFDVIHPDKDFDKERNTRHGSDAEHITYHLLAGADYFVTIDGDILGKRGELADEGVVVLLPEECVRKLAAEHGWNA
jgi:predicted nucleic acid-binding protein